MSIATVQVIRKIVLWLAVAAGIFFFAVSTSHYPVGGTLHEMVEWTGIVLIVACILGRTWASLYIGGRKIDQLVMVGPYSVTRILSVLRDRRRQHADRRWGGRLALHLGAAGGRGFSSAFL
ncbi:MAG: hypothetical protein M5U33_09470 [Pseudorhodoplanes sp.]|nr:hypothetical protein [Pseudorhodoplanes sp.]